MRPGQVEPNELEMAVMFRIAEQYPTIRPFLESLHVLSRKYTGVGSFTEFLADPSAEAAIERQLDLQALISMPGVPNGMGAVLYCRDARPTCLETFTYGDDHWDGRFDGFSIEAAA